MFIFFIYHWRKRYLIIKTIEMIWISLLVSLNLRSMTDIKEYDMNPKAIPSVILKVRGIIIIERNAGNPSRNSLKSIFLTFSVIRNPTNIKAGAMVG